MIEFLFVTIRVGCWRSQTSMLSRSSLVLTARVTIASCWIDTSPPRSRMRASRHSAKALPADVRLSIARLPRV